MIHTKYNNLYNGKFNPNRIIAFSMENETMAIPYAHFLHGEQLSRILVTEPGQHQLRPKN